MVSDHKKTALITGSGSGIGRALAVEAVKDGYHVILVGRSADKLAETASIAGESACTCVAADLNSAEDRARVVAAAGSRLDLLVNNAGMMRAGRLTEQSDKDISMMFSTNMVSALLLTRDLVPALKATRGRIANTGSMFGIIAFPYFAAYSCTKFGLRGMSDALRRELGSFGISVTYVAPRATKTPAQSSFAALTGPFNMILDPPEKVAARAWKGIRSGKRTVYPGPAERFFIFLQSIWPQVVDKSLIKQAFSSETQAALDAPAQAAPQNRSMNQ